MKASIVSTTSIVEMKDAHGNPFMARVWEGETDKGVLFTAYIAVVQVKSEADQGEFLRALSEHKQPSPETRRAIDARFVL